MVPVLSMAKRCASCLDGRGVLGAKTAARTHRAAYRVFEEGDGCVSVDLAMPLWVCQSIKDGEGEAGMMDDAAAGRGRLAAAGRRWGY